MVKPTAIDLFCGAGGLSEGFRQAGYRVLAGNDIDHVAGRTFSATHLDAVFFSEPIQQLSAQKLLAEAGLSKGELDCLIGGPPCQGFSVYNHKRGMHDARSHLFREYLRLVAGLAPKWIVMENVTGILSAGGGAAVSEIKNGLKDLGYRVEMQVMKTEEFGIPQERRRVVFIGTRTSAIISFPQPTHGAGKLGFVTIRDAIGDLPVLKNGGKQSSAPYSKTATTNYQKQMRARSALVHDHNAPRLSQINLDRMKHIPPGGSWRDIPHNLLPEGMKRARRSDHTKRYGRMMWNGLACTILTKCDVHWGAYIHPAQDRAISVREAARLQSFPDWFQFEGSMTDQYVQIGNAVPPLLGKCIAEAILNSTSISEEAGDQRVKTLDLVDADF
jgi:DNA (cytosine-5)-methyltransferase 1